MEDIKVCANGEPGWADAEGRAGLGRLGRLGRMGPWAERHATRVTVSCECGVTGGILAASPGWAPLVLPWNTGCSGPNSLAFNLKGGVTRLKTRHPDKRDGELPSTAGPALGPAFPHCRIYKSKQRCKDKDANDCFIVDCCVRWSCHRFLSILYWATCASIKCARYFIADSQVEN